MVAVLTVFANHLWGWPKGGFIGVDVFFVISGFLITGNLMRTAESTGRVSFRAFYWNRVRRIVPAATVVLVITYLASLLVFLPFRSHQVGVDALFAFVFLANWHSALAGTDYFTATSTVSPLQHYWSLSIEEQFYFVWPALIFVISVLVVRKAWTHAHRMRIAGAAMAVIVAASLGCAVYKTASSPAWAYFDTFVRVWELGVGALLATTVGLLARTPQRARPLLSWGGLIVIFASVFLINEESVGFPAPWAVMPVVGAAAVIAAGVNGEPRFQRFLRNSVSVYIGNISYSLYLVHWPVIVLLGALLPLGGTFYVASLSLSFGLAIASFHLVENPLRRADRAKAREALRRILSRRYEPERASVYGTVTALFLVTVALCAFTVRPSAHHEVPPSVAAAIPGKADPAETQPNWGPLTAALQTEIVQALTAIEWPDLNPTMESAINTPESPLEVHACNDIDPMDPQACTFGSPSAPTRVVVAGDSVALAYGGPLRDLALNSGGQIQVHVTAMGGCEFVDVQVFNPDQSIVDACPARRQRVIESINTTKPDVVIISNIYGQKRVVGEKRYMTDGAWSSSLRQIIDKFRANTKRVVLLSAPPSDKNISECYGARSSVPADCISKVNETWRGIARTEQAVAAAVGGTWIDSRPWFCSSEGYCPSFVGSTPTKLDINHMTLAYGHKIYPVIGEAFLTANIF